MQPISFIFILPAIPHPNTGHYSPFSIAYQGQESILLFFRHPSYRTTRNCGQNVYRAALKKPLLKKRTTPHDTTECGNNLTSQKSSTNEPQSTWGRWEMAGFHQVFERVHGEQKPKTSRNPHRRAWLSSVLCRHPPSTTSPSSSSVGDLLPDCGGRSKVSPQSWTKRPTVTQSARRLVKGGANH